MKKTLSVIADTIILFALLDLAILSAAILQVGVEGRTGYWNGFWLAQAKFVVGLLN